MKLSLDLDGEEALAFRRAFGRFVAARLGSDHYRYRNFVASFLLARAAEAVATSATWKPGKDLAFDAREWSAEERAAERALTAANGIGSEVSR